MILKKTNFPSSSVGGRVMRWFWVNFQCPSCACRRCGWGLFGHFSSRLSFLSLSPSLWETARYRLKYRLQGPLNQPTLVKRITIYTKQGLRPVRCIFTMSRWLVGCFGFNGPLRQYRQSSSGRLPKLVGWLFWVSRPFETVFQSISGPLPKRGRKRSEKTEESKNVQTTPTRTYCKRNRPLPYYIQVVGRPGTGSLPMTIAPPDHPRLPKRGRKRRRVKMSKQPPPVPTASAIGPCPTIIQIVGRPALEVYPGPSHHPTTLSMSRLLRICPLLQLVL